MSVPKVCGIETEYGVIVPGRPDINPMTASSVLVNQFALDVRERLRSVGGANIGWDFEDEHPDHDARADFNRSSVAPTVEKHLANTVLLNGARFYVDHAHPELSTPECISALEAVRFDVAGERILARSMERARGSIDGADIVVYKNNSDGKGQSYGCHENYLVDRATPFEVLVDAATAHFVSRLVYCGAGKVGCEATLWPELSDSDYQISARADFFEEPVGLETTIKRPIVNTRDEPHADPRRYRRLHVIVGDANLSEWATWMKLGTTALWLAAVEDGFVLPGVLVDPVRSLRRVSADPSLRARLSLSNGWEGTAIGLQRLVLAQVIEWVRWHDAPGAIVPGYQEILRAWTDCLEALDADPELLADRVDWIAKRRIVHGMAARHRLSPRHARLKAIDLQYHDIRPERSLAARAGLRRLTSEDTVQDAIWNPPEHTRAYFRGRCLTQFGGSVVMANWDSIVADVGGSRLTRIPMLDPLKGTKAMVGGLLDSCPDAQTLVRTLDARLNSGS